MILRDYQIECINLVLAAYRDNPHGSELVVLPTGCHRAGQGILMYDGTIKLVEDIAIGDFLMGPDSTPRTVLELHRGKDAMVEMCPVKGDHWTVNQGHILSLTHTSQGNKYPSEQGGGVYDVPVSAWFGWTQNKKHIHKLYRVAVDFPLQGGGVLPMHPYLLGALLGDGGLSINGRIHLTNPDKELVDEVERIVKEMGLFFCTVPSPDRCQSYAIRGREGKGRPKAEIQTVQRIMEGLGLFPIRCEKRFIPHIYKIASRQDRLELLAGLLDTDGHLDKGGFEYSSKSPLLANDILFIARSLGFAAYKTLKLVNGVPYYRVFISGDCSIIPTRILRKQAAPRQQKKDVLRTGFTCKPTGTIEDYYGFTVDGDNRYLLDDFTVTHNSGKTVVFSQVIHTLAGGGINTLIVAHRDELLDQAADKYRMVNPSAIIGKVGSGHHEYGGEVTVASVATISRPNHLKQLKAIGYGLVIVDEAHHSQGASYQKVLEALPDAFVLMVTATPDRLDGKLLLNGKTPLYQKNIIEMIAQKYLCDIRAIAIRTEVSLDNIHTQMGDFNEKELGLAVNTPDRNRRVVDAYLEHTPGKRAICFGVTVQHAQALAYAFNDAGIAAACITGETPTDERKTLYAQLRSGVLKILTNVMVLTEGFDEPLIECIIMARPTQSRALYTQCVGRGLRLADNKPYCTILDLTDNCLKHRLMPQNLSKAIGVDVQDKETVEEGLARVEQEAIKEKEAQIRKLKEKRLEDFHVNMFEVLEWKKLPNGTFVMEVTRSKHKIALIPLKKNPDLYQVWASFKKQDGTYGKPQQWMTEQELEFAQQWAEKKVKMLHEKPADRSLLDKNESWRKQRINPDGAQVRKLEYHHIPWSPAMTKGEASDLIEAHLAKKARENAKRVARQAQAVL